MIDLLKLRLPALLLGPALLTACMGMPTRQTAPPETTSGPIRLDLEFVDRLSSEWSLEYLQVYVDGWLVWQGKPQSGSSSLGTHTISGAGDQELHVRAVVSRRDRPGGNLPSKRKVLQFGSGTQKILIQLTGPENFDVALASQ